MTENTELKNNPYDGKVVTDSLGRKITLKKPKAGERYNLSKCMKQDSAIPGCVMQMEYLLYVDSIDGIKFNIPGSLPECIALLNRLEEEGAEAVTKIIMEEMKTKEETLAAIKK